MKSWLLIGSLVLATLGEATVDAFPQKKTSWTEYLKKLNPNLEIIDNMSPYELMARGCFDDYDCRKRETCNLYQRLCERCTEKGELCRRNGHCCGGLDCVWGRCREPLRADGTAKSLCKSHRDCNPGLCCANHEGLKICKPYLVKGQTCSIPLGGHEHFIRHSCPCLHGLKCANPGLDPHHRQCMSEKNN